MKALAIGVALLTCSLPGSACGDKEGTNETTSKNGGPATQNNPPENAPMPLKSGDQMRTTETTPKNGGRVTPNSPPENTPKPDKSVEQKDPGGEAVARATRKEQCESPCLLLAEHSIDTLARDGFCDLCGSTITDACSSPNPFAEEGCDQSSYLRNCVFAGAGYKFKKKKWQKRFGELAWYKGRDDFKYSDLSAVARANVKVLREEWSLCLVEAPVSAKDMALVRRFFRNKRKLKRKLSLPKTLYVDDSPASRRAFLDFLLTDELFVLQSHTPVTYSEWGPAGELDTSKYRSIMSQPACLVHRVHRTARALNRSPS